MSVDTALERPPVRSERPEPGIAVVFLDRPHQRNSLSVALMAALHGEIAALGTDPAVSAIVLAADGPPSAPATTSKNSPPAAPTPTADASSTPRR